jgi:RNA polymerase sigma factor (sigma-70 family)
MTKPTEGEQNRLIIEHSFMVEPIAAAYRGRKGIPFEDLVAEGMLALVEAARRWRPVSKFSIYADKWIHGEIKKFIDRWEQMDQLDELSDEDENRIHEWQVWGIFPSDGWNSLPATPQEIMEIYESAASDSEALSAAMLSLTAYERKLISARFLRKPTPAIEQIARDNRRSYFETVTALYDAVKKLRGTVKRFKKNRHLFMAAA